MDLWSKQTERNFFNWALERQPDPAKLFYVAEGRRYLAYWPKSYRPPRGTLQSRNTLIGQFGDQWCTSLLEEAAKDARAFAVRGAVCPDLGLTKASSADVAICRRDDRFQRPGDILLVAEVKISVVWNWELELEGNKRKLHCLGDYTTHSGQPSFLRSDTILKAIGKAVNVRVSSPLAARIPIVVIGNAPIRKGYYKKVDQLHERGFIQGFWSVNPRPWDSDEGSPKSSPGQGFYRYDDYPDLRQRIAALLRGDSEFFSAMLREQELGRIIATANQEVNYAQKARRFLELIRSPGQT